MIGNVLKQLRTEKKLRQLDVAEFLGVSRTTYTQYETNVSEPDLDTIVRLADFFSVPTDYLIGRAPQKTTNGQSAVIDLDSLKIFARASIELPEDEMQKIKEYAAMLIEKHNRQRKPK